MRRMSRAWRTVVTLAMTTERLLFFWRTSEGSGVVVGLVFLSHEVGIHLSFHQRYFLDAEASCDASQRDDANELAPHVGDLPEAVAQALLKVIDVALALHVVFLRSCRWGCTPTTSSPGASTPAGRHHPLVEPPCDTIPPLGLCLWAHRSPCSAALRYHFTASV